MKKTFILFLSLVLIAFFLPYGISEILSRTRGQAVADPSFLECDAITSGSFDDSFKITVTLWVFLGEKCPPPIILKRLRHRL